MKRFYEDVTVVAVDEERADTAWQILLDGKPIRNHDGDAILAPNFVLANAISEEWRAVEVKINLYNMWLTRLAGGATSVTDGDRARLIDDMVGYANTDLLCYFSDDEQLLKLQQEKWQPLLSWAQLRFGASLNHTTGLMPLVQPEKVVDAIRNELERINVYQLTAASRLVGLFGSILLFMACFEGEISYEEAINLSLLDEQYQAKRWGEDVEAAQAQKAKKQEMRELAKYLELVSK